MRHAKASRITVDLGLEGSMLVLEVADDGVGLPPAGPRGRSLGLLGMGERARRLGGDCLVSQLAPTGTRVSLRVPLRQDHGSQPITSLHDVGRVRLPPFPRPLVVHGSSHRTRASSDSSSSAEDGRFAGSFSRHFIRIASSCFGIGSSDLCDGGSGRVWAWCRSICAGVFAWNSSLPGERPVRRYTPANRDRPGRR